MPDFAGTACLGDEYYIDDLHYKPSLPRSIPEVHLSRSVVRDPIRS